MAWYNPTIEAWDAQRARTTGGGSAYTAGGTANPATSTTSLQTYGTNPFTLATSTTPVDTYVGPAYSPGPQNLLNEAAANPVQFDPSTVATDTAKANLAASPYNVDLTNLINQTNIAAQQAANQARLGPQGAGLEAARLENIGAGLAGEVAPSTLRALRMDVAGDWGNLGFGVDSGGRFTDELLRYTKSAEERQKEAATQLSSAYADNPAAPIFDMSKLFETPETYQSGLESAASRAQAAREAAASLQQRYDTEATQAGQFQSEFQLKQAQQAEQIRQYNLDLAERQRQFNAGRGTSYGGGGTTPRGGYSQSTSPFGAGGYQSGVIYGGSVVTNPYQEPSPIPTGNMYSDINFTGTPTGGYTPGYQPTSSGTMYSGSVEGYDEDPYAWVFEE